MTENIDLITIGAGPAGLTAAQYGARAGLSVLLLEQLAAGGQLQLIDVLENYPGIAPGKTGYDFSEDLRRQAEDFGAAIMNDSAETLKKEGRFFIITTGSGKTFKTSAVILATGARFRGLGIPGEKEYTGRGVSYCATCDGPLYKNKKVFVVGGGDAACGEAVFLSRLTNQVILIHRRDKFRAQKVLADRTLNNPNIQVRFNTAMTEIKGDAKKIHSVVLGKTGADGLISDTETLYEENTDSVFIFSGTVPQTSLVTNGELRVDLDEQGYIVTDEKRATTVPGLFAIGDLRASVFRQVVTAAADGAIAAHCAAAYIESLNDN